MKFLEIRCSHVHDGYVYIGIDSRTRVICPNLQIRAVDNNDGTYKVISFSSRREQPNYYTIYDVTPDNMECVITEDEICHGYYSGTKWTYLSGVYNVSYDYHASVVSASDVISNSLDAPTLAAAYIELGDYEKARSLVDPILAPDPNYYYFVNREANRVKAQMLEKALGCEKSLDEAFFHYLYAQDYESIVRFMDMGYGKGVLSEDYHSLDWDEHYVLKLLYSLKKDDDVFYRMIFLAECFTYKHKEKISKRDKALKKHKSGALARLCASEWIMERGDYKNVENGNLELFLGAYFSWLSQGHEGMCSYENDNGGGSMSQGTSLSCARKYLQDAAEAGSELALRALKYISDITKKDDE